MLHTVPWSPSIARAGMHVTSLVYNQLWRVMWALADFAKRSTVRPWTSVDVAVALDIPHIAVRGAIMLLGELGVIDRDGAEMTVHTMLAPRYSIADDFTADERTFAERFPDTIAELDNCIAEGLTSPAAALAAF